MDGLVSNIALIAGIGAAGAPPQVVVITGVAGLVAGAFSMALGEYTSVKTANEQVDSELEIERQAHARNPQGEENELVSSFMDMGLSKKTAAIAAAEIHQNSEQAARVHLSQELGVNPDAQPSPWLAAVSSFSTFAVGAFIPLIPYALGFELLWLGLATGGVGLLIAGGIAARFTRKSWWRSALRQLLFGSIAVAATFLVGSLLGVGS
jgi:VIT1/CCC1 family predicted Fe2+/Mn2+ transporter